MKKILLPPLMVLLSLACSMAFADEVDFYLFRTTHDASANEEAAFRLYVRRTNLVNYRVDDQDDFRCLAKPTAPGGWSCKVKGEWLWLGDSEASARTVLAKFGISSQIRELSRKEAGVFQAVLHNDDVYHVTMKAPSVVDDSMKCELAVNRDKKLASLKCASEFTPADSFLVRGIPVADTTGAGIILGRTASEPSDEASNRLVRQVLDGMSRLKKAPVVEADAVAVGLTLNVLNGGYTDLLYVHLALEGAVQATTVTIRDSVEHIERGALRQGD